MPRKFKIAIAIPPFNDVDVYANDIGLVAIVEKEKLIGFNIMAGGGMGTTHGNEATYPRLGSLLGFVSTNRVMDLSPPKYRLYLPIAVPTMAISAR